MRISIIIIAFLSCAAGCFSQNKIDTLPTGKWTVTRCEFRDRIMDLEDTSFTLQLQIEQFKKMNSIVSLKVDDSLKLREEFREGLKEMAEQRFSITFNADNSFIMHGDINGPEARHAGTYLFNKALHRIELTLYDEKTKLKETQFMNVIEARPDKLIIQLPSSDANVQEFKWTLKRI